MAKATHNVTTSITGPRLDLQLPKHAGLAAVLAAAGIGELAAAADPKSGGSPVVSMRNMRAVELYRAQLAAAPVPSDPETAGLLASVAARFGVTVPAAAAPAAVPPPPPGG
jgi:hypothetical protein